MESYKRWVRNNSEFVRSLESLANGLTWVLPERFSNSEIAPEAVYAFLGIVSAINQHIVDTEPKGNINNEEKSAVPWSLCISMVKDVETVVEVAAHCYAGEERKWNYLAVTEAVKAFIRLAAFRDSGFKMQLQGGEKENEDQVEESLEMHNGGFRDITRPVRYNGNCDLVPKNFEGRAISALSRFGEKAKMHSDQVLLNRIQKIQKSPVLPVEKPSFSSIWSQKGFSGQSFMTGEMLFILRPLVYVLFIKRFGIQSWKPWLISLAMDLTGMCILSRVTTHSLRSDGKHYQLSISEKDELKRRKLMWAFYIIRDPFFNKYTKYHLQNTNTRLSHVPFIGFLSDKVVDLILGAQSRYTYISGL